MTWLWEEDRTYFMVPLWQLNSTFQILPTHLRLGAPSQSCDVDWARFVTMWHCPFSSERRRASYKHLPSLSPRISSHGSLSSVQSFICDSHSWAMHVSGVSYEHRIWVSSPKSQGQQFVWLADGEFLRVWLLSLPPAFVYSAELSTWPGFQITVNICDPWLKAFRQRWPCPMPQGKRKHQLYRAEFLSISEGEDLWMVFCMEFF